MSVSTFALMVAVLELLVGIPLFLFPGRTAEWVLALTRDGLLYRTIGGLFMIICVLVLAEDSSVGTDVAGLVRLVVWVGAVRSLIICWWPEIHARWAERMLYRRVAQRLLGVTGIAAGVLLAMASASLR